MGGKGMAAYIARLIIERAPERAERGFTPDELKLEAYFLRGFPCLTKSLHSS